VLEAAGDLGLDQEAPAARGVVGKPVEDLLERDLTVQLGVERDENRTMPPERCGRRTRNRRPRDDDVPTEKLGVGSASPLADSVPWPANMR